MTEGAKAGVPVWDLFLRLFHWLLVLCLGVSWGTAELGVEYREYHFYSGYCALGLIIFRLLWGLFGTPYARFLNFLRGPGHLFAYLQARFSRATPPEIYPGHNPVGGWAAIALLAMVAAQAITGLFADDDILYTGPYNEAVSDQLAGELTQWHHQLFDGLLVLVVVHLIAIVVYRFGFNERLTAAMLHGRKGLAAFGAFAPLGKTPWLRGLLAIALAAASVWLLLELAPEPVYDEYYY